MKKNTEEMTRRQFIATAPLATGFALAVQPISAEYDQNWMFYLIKAFLVLQKMLNLQKNKNRNL